MVTTALRSMNVISIMAAVNMNASTQMGVAGGVVL
jgi:hypothetical protein